MKKIAIDWMNEAVGYRETFEVSEKKIKILQAHTSKLEDEFKQRNTKMKLEFDI
jgi:hypothetical protein